jgi:hypothetical protein
MKDLKIKTDADKLLDLVRYRGRISLREAAKILKEDEKVIEELAKILHNSGMLELVYPANPFVQPFMRIKEEKKEEQEKPKKIGKKISLPPMLSLKKIKEIVIPITNKIKIKPKKKVELKKK